MGSVIAVTSGKGGTGKTAVTANLGAALAQRGKKALLIDTDIGLRSLDLALGLDGEVVYDLTDVTEGSCDLAKAIVRHETLSGLYLLPASQTKDSGSVTATQLRCLTEAAAPDYDFVLIDCPSGVGPGFRAAAAAADEVIVVVLPEAAALRGADRTLGLLEREGVDKARLIINRLRPSLVRRGLMPDVEGVVSELSVDLLGAVPEDEALAIAANSLDLVILDTKSEAGRAFRNIAARLCGESVDLIDFKARRGLIKRLMGA